MKFATLPRILCRSLQHRHHKARNLCACQAKRIVSEPLQIPPSANVFATLTNSCACHVFATCRKLCACRLPRKTHPPKTSRAPGVLTILTSKSFSRAGVVQFLRSSTSKGAPCVPVFNFDFQIALARRRGANFAELNFQRCSAHASF